MSNGEAAPESSAGLWLRLGASLVLAVGFAVALAPYLSTIPADLSIAPWVIVAYLGSLLPYHLLRSGRWYFLIRPLGAVSARDATLVSLAGYMWIAIMPFRLGEFARPLFLAQRSDVTVSKALGSVAIERVIDGLAVCGLFFVGIVGTSATPQSEALYQGTLVVMSAFAAAVVVLAVMARFPGFAGRIVEVILAPISRGVATRVSGLFTGVSEGLAALPSARPLAAFTATTIAYWLANAAGMWLLAYGVGLELGFREVVTVLAVMNLALLIPGGPAQFGVFQTGVALGLSLYLSPSTIKDSGSLFTFYLYVCQLATIAALGIAAQRFLGLDWRTLFSARRRAAIPSAKETE
jgi:uncharacterized protein (TIRG00374 family)